MTLFKKLVILSHRYLGIALSLLVITWFLSGIVMMYAGGMPRLTPQLRLDRLPALELSRVRISPADAAERVRAERDLLDQTAPRRPAGGRGGGARVQLTTIMERPAYRVGNSIVFADSGDVLKGVSLTQAHAVVARFMRVDESRVHFVDTLTSVDQWTLGQSRAMPLHKFRIDDDAGTEVYLQPMSGDITTLTTRKSRLLAWIGTIPHWLYFASLRENQPLWYDIVVWTATAACIVALLGLVLSVMQFRKIRPFVLAKAIPYSGWMRWHYITGAVFGVFTLTWAFSGLLSMEPYAWTNARGLEARPDLLTGGPPDFGRFPVMDDATWTQVLDGRAIKEVDFVRILDRHYYSIRQAPLDAGGDQRRERLHQPYYVTGTADPDRVLVDAESLAVVREPFGMDTLVARFTSAFPDQPVVAAELLTDYDSYYYSRARQTPLPVVRIKFGDPAETWFYVDPAMAQTLAQIPRLARVERWLYNGLHSLDFAFWYNRRPLWDIVMITLLLGGLASTVFGLVMGIKRLRRGTVRVARKAFTPTATSTPVQPQAAALSATRAVGSSRR